MKKSNIALVLLALGLFLYIVLVEWKKDNKRDFIRQRGLISDQNVENIIGISARKRSKSGYETLYNLRKNGTNWAFKNSDLGKPDSILVDHIIASIGYIKIYAKVPKYPEQKLDKPSLEITVSLKGGEKKIIKVGATGVLKKNIYVAVDGQNFLVHGQLRKDLEKKWLDLLDKRIFADILIDRIESITISDREITQEKGVYFWRKSLKEKRLASKRRVLNFLKEIKKIKAKEFFELQEKEFDEKAVNWQALTLHQAGKTWKFKIGAYEKQSHSYWIVLPQKLAKVSARLVTFLTMPKDFFNKKTLLELNPKDLTTLSIIGNQKELELRRSGIKWLSSSKEFDLDENLLFSFMNSLSSVKILAETDSPKTPCSKSYSLKLLGLDGEQESFEFCEGEERVYFPSDKTFYKTADLKDKKLPKISDLDFKNRSLLSHLTEYEYNTFEISIKAKKLKAFKALDWEIKEPFSFPGSKGIDKFREKLFSLKANSFQEKSELLDANNSEMIIKFVPDKIRFKNMPDVELFLGKPQKNGKTLGKLSIGKEYFLIDSEIFQIDPYSFFSESFLSFSKEDFQGLELLRGGKSIKWEFSKGKLSFEEANGKISEVLVKEFNEEKIVIKVDAFSGQHLEEKHFKRSTLLRFQLKSGQKQLYFFTKGRDYFVSTGLNHPVFKLKNPDLFRKIGKI